MCLSEVFYCLTFAKPSNPRRILQEFVPRERRKGPESGELDWHFLGS